MAAELTDGHVPTNVKKLRGTDVPDEWRLRTGNYRVRFQNTARDVEVEQSWKCGVITVGVVVVLRASNRRDVYQG
jgi:hypothetical protein